jgi:hypothetical protein
MAWGTLLQLVFNYIKKVVGRWPLVVGKYAKPLVACTGVKARGQRPTAND